MPMTMLIINRKLLCICTTVSSTLWNIYLVVTIKEKKKSLKCIPQIKNPIGGFLLNTYFSTCESRGFIFTNANKNSCL